MRRADPRFVPLALAILVIVWGVFFRDEGAIAQEQVLATSTKLVPRWQIEVAKLRTAEAAIQTVDNNDSVSSFRPTIVDGIVVATIVDTITAVDIDSGRRLWFWGDPWHNDSINRIYNHVACDGRNIFSAYCEESGGAYSHFVTVLDALEYGHHLWTVAFRDVTNVTAHCTFRQFCGPPISENGRLCVLAQDDAKIRLLVYESRTGEALAQLDIAALGPELKDAVSTNLQPAFVGRNVVICPTPNGDLVAVDLQHNRILWRNEWACAPSSQTANPDEEQSQHRRNIEIAAIADRFIVTSTKPNVVRCFSVSSGSEVWRYVDDNAMVYAGARDGFVLLIRKNGLTTLRLEDGAVVWSTNATQMGASPPSGSGFYTERYYLLPTTGKEVLAVDIRNGHVGQRFTTPQQLGSLVHRHGVVISQSAVSIDGYTFPLP